QRRAPRTPPRRRGAPNSGPPRCGPNDRLTEERSDMHDCFKPLPELLAEYDRALAYTEDLWRDLDPDEVVWRPHQDSSAIGWHLGHQAHVAHFMVRNLTAAEPSPDPDLDGIMDSANPEQFRGTLPTIDRLRSFRSTVAERVHDRVGAIAAGNVAAPDQLTMTAGTTRTANLNHQYQHAQWISEVPSQSLAHHDGRNDAQRDHQPRVPARPVDLRGPRPEPRPRPARRPRRRLPVSHRRVPDAQPSALATQPPDLGARGQRRANRDRAINEE